MTKCAWTFALLAAVLSAGCFNVTVPKNAVNIDAGGGDGSSQLPGGDYIDIASSVTLGAEYGILFYAYDSLAYPKKPVMLAAKLQSVRRRLAGVEGVTLGFYYGRHCIATAVTDADGLAKTRWTPPKEGDYHFTVKIESAPDDLPEADEGVTKVLPSPLLIAARPKNTDFVVIDLDHTVVDASFFRVLTFGAKPMADSVEVTQRIARRYTIIYLTHRPDLLTRKSKNWLTDHDFPAGPLMVSELRDAIGDSGEFKTAKLRAVRKSFPDVKIGIGDKLSDAQAYVDNGLTAYLIPDYKDKPKDMRKMAKKIDKLNGRGRLNVVNGWRDIEAGIFDGRRFPPDRFVRDLKNRADRLEREKKDKKKKKKKDDDDDDD